MNYGNLLYRREYSINDKISILIPTIGEVIDRESEYYSFLSVLTSMPIDMMVQLDDIGIDFTKINDYELFLIMFGVLKGMDSSIMFNNLDLSKFNLSTNEINGDVILRDDINGITIDRAIHNQIAEFLRHMHHLERNNKKPGNEEARKYMIDRARKKMKRNKNKDMKSQLEPLIISLVNTEQFKYDFDSVRRLTIYQFNESVRQISKKIAFDNRMIGVYSGCLDTKKLSQEDLSWITY